MPRRTTDYRGLTEPNRVRLLGAVQEHPDRSLKELAEAVGLHVNTVRDHLGVLIAEGLVSSRPRPCGTRGRPPTVYRAVDDAQMNPAARKRIDEARRLGPVLRRIGMSCRPQRVRDLGEDAGDQFETLFEHLDDSGLEPVADETELRVSLAACPHLQLDGDERTMACAVHARLLRDILAQVPGPLTIDEVEPFLTPDSCELRLLAARSSAQTA
ncbi:MULTISPECIES: helix-turn-helix domain-containing protein [Brevibacterium]|uniref:Predicted transcriptional regulator n=2 Tax=Brevibacterium TaxID=1696 RepID=A0A449D9T5_9MICO|nr:helix-turn-helix domain-containing protein [Brevibacterium casei]NJE66424.1 winged helix-turn-helix transcriptional regulator [Brevibacterium sp. LS14]MCT1549981.1 winged helix-turn-helix transcriptional regulator [Brevibacterium casei]MCT1560904.1 winged helix-turn-helix transcriptional regulator [Brevibacterium casei]MCT2208069.1 winged helix-turn-helix transcriptional regulator [Brevibacterium casei]VEW14322.1 Predicted transcriptional regulator [Brevibacterium casei]